MKTSGLKQQLQQAGAQFLHVRIPLFLLLVAVVYGFIIWKIDTLQNAEPKASAVASKLQSSPHIDQATVNKVTELQDNSVSVQALFNQARQNPFSE